MDNRMFFITFPNVAYALQYFGESRNNNNRPNKKNDVITDLGGEGDFPMFLFTSHFSLLHHLERLTRLSHLVACTTRPQSTRETGSSAGLLGRE
jgi:hypothetical protein